MKSIASIDEEVEATEYESKAEEKLNFALYDELSPKEQAAQMRLHAKRAFDEYETGKLRKGFWQWFSVFQVPDLTEFRGSSEASVLLYLYKRARGYSFYSQSEREISFSSLVETIETSTELSFSSVNRALQRLEEQNYIRRENNKCLDTSAKDYYSDADRIRGTKGKFCAGKITLLNPSTGVPLHTQPGGYDVCQYNLLLPYLTIPSDAMSDISKMGNAELAVYLTAFRFVSLRQTEQLVVSKKAFRQQARLERKSFNRAFKKLKAKKLISYAGSVLAVNDPKTGRLPERWKFKLQGKQYDPDFTEHKKICDLVHVKPERWKTILKEAGLDLQWRTGSKKGASEKSKCPKCDQNHFVVYLDNAGAKCYEAKKERKSEGCGYSIPLGKLVQDLQGFETMKETLRFIARFIPADELREMGSDAPPELV